MNGETWQMIAMAALSLCPLSTILGLVGGVMLLRAFGTRWPWEHNSQDREQSSYGRVPPQKTLYRIAAEDSARVVQRELDDGWRYTGTGNDGAGIVHLSFIKLGGGNGYNR